MIKSPQHDFFQGKTSSFMMQNSDYLNMNSQISTTQRDGQKANKFKKNVGQISQTHERGYGKQKFSNSNKSAGGSSLG